MRKYWAAKEKLRIAKGVAHGRSNLREMERAVHQLQSCIGDETCDAKKLRDECRAAHALIERIEAPSAASGQRAGLHSPYGAGSSPVGERAGCLGDEAKRDSMASEFLHELQRALLPAMACPWLVAARGAHLTPLGLLHIIVIPCSFHGFPIFKAFSIFFRIHICYEFPTFTNFHIGRRIANREERS